MSDEQPPGLAELSRAALLWRKSKQRVLQAERLARWAASPGRWPAPMLAPSRGFEILQASSSVAISRSDEEADPLLEAGKRHNVRLAAPALDGLLIAPDRPLSLWRALGRLTERAGYRYGLALRGGCLTPSVGGGVCLVGNALFELAARQGWHVLERHGHTLEAVPPDEGALWGLDATLAWPYVDLVVAPREEPVRLGVRVQGDTLRLTVHGATAPRTRARLWAEEDRVVRMPGGWEERANRVVRRVEAVADGALIEEATIAENRRRLLDRAARGRTCLSCGEERCHARVEIPSARAAG